MNLNDVMDEIGDRLDAIAGLRVFRYPPAQPPAPPSAIVTYPDDYVFDETYGRGMDRITLPVVLLVGKVSDRASRDRISDWISRSGVRRYEVEATDQLTKHTMTAVSGHASGVAINGENLEFTLTSGSSLGTSLLRDVYIRDDIEAADFHARATFDPPFYGGAGNVLPQHGIVLRYQQDTVQRAVVIWQNILFAVPLLLVGVWQANLNGTGFTNRSATGFPPPVGLSFPYTVECRLRDNIVTVRQWEVDDPVPDWDDPVLARTINLDTDAGNAGTIPTPTGTGGAGVVAAHLSADVDPTPSMVRYPLNDLYWEVDSVSIKDALEADLASYTAFDSLRVMTVEFDVVTIGGVDYLSATLNIDIAGVGSP